MIQKKLWKFLIAATIAALLLVVLTVPGTNMIQQYLINIKAEKKLKLMLQNSTQFEEQQKHLNVVERQRFLPTFRFNDGLITITKGDYLPHEDQLSRMQLSELELAYEHAMLTTTADCSTARRFGRRDDGGWDLCLVGPFVPVKPCFSFSFGINEVWEYDDEIAKTFQCTVLAFDPSMKAKSHRRSRNVWFFKEGIHSRKKMLKDWPVDSFAGFLQHFGAQDFIIDILKMDVEGSEWPALHTAVQDGSLKNVKQLLLETHLPHKKSKENIIEYMQILRQLHNLGFRQWHRNWNDLGRYSSSLNYVKMTCCHELYFININFLFHNAYTRNSLFSKLDTTNKTMTTRTMPLSKTSG